MTYGFLSLLPSLIAIILAITTKQVFISLFAGILIGKLIMTNWTFFPALGQSIDSVVNVFSEGWVTKTIIFSFLVGSVVTLIQASGGVEGFVYYLTEKNKRIKNRKAAMLLAYFIGIVVFIESTITCLIVGTVSRPICDKYKVSREKLAYICDSTSAPVCSLLPFNSWGATLLGLIAAQIGAGVISGNSVDLLIKSIPFNFYAISTLITLLIVILTGKDFGPMKKAELRAITEGKLLRDGAMPVVDQDAIEINTKEGVAPNMNHMLLPLLVLVLMIPISLYITGDGVIFNGSGSTSVFWAVLASLVFSGFYYIGKRLMTLNEFMDYVYKGAGAMIPVAAILAFAFAIGNISSELETGKYMASLVEGKLNGSFGPAVIFIMSSIIAFSTGTSFGTFAIMIPIAIQMAVAMDANIYMSIGAVISGAIMGDHSSPISDTTIVSSMASASDHIDHVKTQLPYALLNGAVALILYIVLGIFL